MTPFRTLAIAGSLATGVLTLAPEAARAASLTHPLQVSEPGELLKRVHAIPLKGQKGGGTWGNHKQCLYGVYGSQGQYKGYHKHGGPYDRGQPCAPFLNPGADLPGKLFWGQPPSRIRSPR